MNPETGKPINVRDFAERWVWTVVVVGAGNLAGAALFNVDAWKMGAATGLAAGLQVITTFGRYRLKILPNPGEGLPGLPVDEPQP